MTPDNPAGPWRKQSRAGLRGVPAGRRATHPVETAYGRRQRQRDWLAMRAAAIEAARKESGQMPKRTTRHTVTTEHGDFEVIRRPNSRGTSLADKTEPHIVVDGPGVFQILGRSSMLCGVPDGSGGKESVNALDATDEQIVWALTHDKSVFD